MSDKKVIGFQMGHKGRKEGYGSTKILFGKESVTVKECQEKGLFETPYLSYVYEKETA